MNLNSQGDGTLTSGAAVQIGLPNLRVPATLTLKSAAGGRLIRLSTDGGVEYFIPTIDQTTATMQVVTINAPISHIEVSGQAGDTWVLL